MGNQYGVHGAGGALRTHTLCGFALDTASTFSIAGPLYKVRSELSPDLNRYTEQSVFTTVLSGVRHGLVPCWCLSLFPLSRRSYQGEALQLIVTPQSPFPKKTSYSTIRA